MAKLVTPRRMKKILDVLAMRTRYLTVVLEDIYQSQNASAVLRSCECFGIQDAHIIENRYQFEINPEVVMGASKWLSIHQSGGLEDNTIGCLQGLKDNGYQLIATTPHKREYSPENLPLDQKTALVFGTELEGLSESAKQMADGFMKIPMVGFTESFNISVSVALSLYHLTNRLHSGSYQWQLPVEEETDLLFEWICKSLKNPEKLIRHFQENL